jgi:hypothetical protein
MDHRTVHDLELEVRRVKLELERIVQEDGDADAYCVDIADNAPVLGLLRRSASGVRRHIGTSFRFHCCHTHFGIYQACP